MCVIPFYLSTSAAGAAVLASGEILFVCCWGTAEVALLSWFKKHLCVFCVMMIHAFYFLPAALSK
jgi:hypothetical protein